jgi:hypothetical protein
MGVKKPGDEVPRLKGRRVLKAPWASRSKIRFFDFPLVRSTFFRVGRT